LHWKQPTDDQQHSTRLTAPRVTTTQTGTGQWSHSLPGCGRSGNFIQLGEARPLSHLSSSLIGRLHACVFVALCSASKSNSSRDISGQAETNRRWTNRRLAALIRHSTLLMFITLHWMVKLVCLVSPKSKFGALSE